MTRILILLLIVILLTPLAACGNKGDLVRAPAKTTAPAADNVAPPQP